MLKGSVSFVTLLHNSSATVEKFEFDPKIPGVEKVEMEGTDGKVLQTTVHLPSVKTKDAGIVLATQANDTVLRRLAFAYSLGLADSRHQGESFIPLNPPVGQAVGTVSGSTHFGWKVSGTAHAKISPAVLKKHLETGAAPGERHYDLFRSALNSTGPVEGFMHLYHILLMLFNDEQVKVDKFIVVEEPTVTQTQHPKKKAGVKETVYSRLRNEFAHKRPNVDVETTKTEMATLLPRMRELTKTAIKQNP